MTLGKIKALAESLLDTEYEHIAVQILNILPKEQDNKCLYFLQGQCMRKNNIFNQCFGPCNKYLTEEHLALLKMGEIIDESK